MAHESGTGAVVKCLDVSLRCTRKANPVFVLVYNCLHPSATGKIIRIASILICDQTVIGKQQYYYVERFHLLVILHRSRFDATGAYFLMVVSGLQATILHISISRRKRRIHISKNGLDGKL